MGKKSNVLFVISAVGALILGAPQAFSGSSIPVVGTLVPEEIAPMAAPHDGGGVVSYDGKLYVWGGRDQSGAEISTLEIYDPETNSWTSGSNAPVATQGMGDFGLGDRIYTVGGEGPGFTSAAYGYDPSTNAWQAKSGFPTSIWEPMEAVCDGKGYILSGRHGYGRAYEHIYEYDPASEAWTQRADMPYYAAYGGAVAYDGKIWVFGGNHQTSESDHEWVRTVQVYDPNTDTWTFGDDMPTPQLYNTQAVVFDDDVWLFSRYVYDDALATWGDNEYAYRFSPDDNTWTSYRFVPPTGFKFSYRCHINVIGSSAYFAHTYENSVRSNKVFRVEIGAICGDADHPYPVGDLDFDCEVNFSDFAVMVANWLECTKPECE